jgi:hypothetical protein
MEINLKSFNIDSNNFMLHYFNQIMSNGKKILISEYLNNKDNKNKIKTIKGGKQKLKNKIKTIENGKQKLKFTDMYGYVLSQMYDLVDDNNKKNIQNYFNDKMLNLHEQLGGTAEDDIKNILQELNDKLSSGTLNEDSKKETVEKLYDFFMTQQKLMLESGYTNGTLFAGPIGANILNITRNMQKMTSDDIHKLTEQQTISNLYSHLGNLTNVKLHSGNDVKNIVDFFKSHALFSTMYLNNVVKEISKSGENKIVYDEINKNLNIHKNNLIAVIGKIKIINETVKQASEQLKSEEDYVLYPLDFKIVSFKYLDKLYPGKKEYYINPDAIKIQFQQIPDSVSKIVDQIKKRADEANKKVPGLASNIFTTVQDVNTFNELIKNIKINPTSMYTASGGGPAFGGGGKEDVNANIISDMLTKIDNELVKTIEFSAMNTNRKETSERIRKVAGLINEMDSNVNDLVETIEIFNLNESREHYFSYVMANLALNANTKKKYKYMSFGVIDFYKSIIDTIFRKIDYDKNGEEKLTGSDSKYLFFYHYHYKIIKKLKIFLDKFYEMKNLNIFYTNNTFIEIAGCTGKTKEYLSLLNIYKYLLDDFYSKIGLTKSSSNVSVYLRINDFPRQKLLVGRQYGTYYSNSAISDPGTGTKGAFMHNIELLNKNNIHYLGEITDDKYVDLAKDINGTKGKDNNDEVDKKLLKIHDLILNSVDFVPKNLWQVWQKGGTQYSNIEFNKATQRDVSVVPKQADHQPYYVKMDSNGKDLFADDGKARDYFGNQYDENVMKDDVLYEFNKKDSTLNDLYMEREKKRFFLVNRKVPSVDEDNYTLESLDLGVKYILQFEPANVAGLNPDKFEFLKDNADLERPNIAKIVFLPLLKLMTNKSIDDLGLKQLHDAITTLKTELHNKNLHYDLTIGKKTDKSIVTITETVNVTFNDNNICLNFYVDMFNNKKIYVPLLLGFVPSKPVDGDFLLTEKYDNNSAPFVRYRNKLDGLKIDSFQLVDRNTAGLAGIFNYNTYDRANDGVNYNSTDTYPRRYHYLLKKYFNTLFFEQTKYHRDESELIFTASADDKKLVVSDTEKCKRLLDRYVNEDDYLQITDKFGKSVETEFNHVFSSEKTPDNESIAMFMSIPSKLSLGNGFMLLTFGYSGTGKTYTVFGDKTAGGRGILQTTLDEIDKDGDEVYFRCYEMYGIGLPYANYWYDKLGNDYDAKRVELLIHHNFKPNGDVLEIEKQHIFDDPNLKKLYLNNVNWFFPDAGRGLYKTEKDVGGTEFYSGESLGGVKYDYEFEPDKINCPLDEATYFGDSSCNRIEYLKYSNKTDKAHVQPKIYSIYENNIITEQQLNVGLKDNGQNYNHKLDPGTNVKGYKTVSFGEIKNKNINTTGTDKNKSTYVKIPKQQIDNFGELIKKIDKNRIDKIENNVLFNNGETIPTNYKNYIRRIKETSNNPESSRSIIFYEFVIKLKEPQLVTTEDEYGRQISVWRYYVTLLIVDLPGQEDIKTSFVEKPEYNFVNNSNTTHQPTFSIDTTKTVNEQQNYFQNNLSFSYQEKNDIKDTNTDPSVYEYNELLQKLIKSTVYMNPIFKLMSKMTLKSNDKYDIIPYDETDLKNEYLLGLNWVGYNERGDDDTGIELLNTKIINYSTNYQQDYVTLLDSIVKQTDKSKGSDIYRNNINYILDGIRLYQKNPLDYLVDYVFEEIKNSDEKICKALSPYEGYMINENVGSLITYLYNKTKPKTVDRKINKLKDQQHNFAMNIKKNKLLPVDMCTSSSDPDCESINIDEPEQADSKTTGTAPYTISHMIDKDLSFINTINETFDDRNYNTQSMEIQNPHTILSYFLNTFFSATSGVKLGTNGISINAINNEDNGTNYLPDILDSINKKPGLSKTFTKSDGKTLITYKEYDYIYDEDTLNTNEYNNPTTDEHLKFKDMYDNYSSKINKDLTPLKYSKLNNDGGYQNKNLNSITVDNGAEINKLIRGVKSLWIAYYKNSIKYMFYVEIFLILKKLRGCDKYFREHVMKHTLSSNNFNGRLIDDKTKFDENLNKLKIFYKYYIDKVINRKENETKPNIGIYNKNYLFRNGETNKYLDEWNAHFYVDRNKNDGYIVSQKNDLESTYPELEMMNKKPLIYSYLEPYEPYFNSYSLLYVMSNNDPHIKCFKQMDLLNENKNFLNAVINV